MKIKKFFIYIFRILLLFIIPLLTYTLGLIPSMIILKLSISNLNLNSYTHLIILLLIIVLEIYIMVFSEIIASSLIINIFKIKYSEGEYDLNLLDNAYFKYKLFTILYLPIINISRLFILFPFIKIYNQILGAKIGKNVRINGLLADPFLIEIGDNSVVGGGAVIISHAAEKKFLVKKIKIGNNCVIGGWSQIMIGVTMEDNSILGARSFVPKYTVLKKGKKYAGIPVKEI